MPKHAEVKKKKEFEWAVLDGVLQFNATKPQCASLLKTSEDTIERRIKKKFNISFAEYKETKMGLTKIKLQQKAIQMALGGNPTMMIFCLKNLCNWKDRFDVENANPINQERMIVNLNIPSNGREVEK
jgi:hypothetical protein